MSPSRQSAAASASMVTRLSAPTAARNDSWPFIRM